MTQPYRPPEDTSSPPPEVGRLLLFAVATAVALMGAGALTMMLAVILARRIGPDAAILVVAGLMVAVPGLVMWRLWPRKR